MIAAGRIAFNSLRLEKGYRAWGTDMTAEHHPSAAGLDFAVRMNKDDFVGKAALEAPPPENVLRSIVFDDPAAVVLGKEPVYVDGSRRAGYVTSAAYSATLGRSIAYAWLPAAVGRPATAVTVDYFGEQVLPPPSPPSRVVDPEMARIRR